VSMILRLLLLSLSLSLAAAPVLAQRGEPRAWDARAGRWVAWGTMADADLAAMFDARASVEARAAAGGTSPASVQAQIAELTAPLL
jgi:argininosuccinate lyase